MSFVTTIIGNLTSDLELRYTQGGAPVASGTVAVNDRKFNRQTNEWEDGEATFVRVSVWRELGEHAAASLAKGQRVIASGKVGNRSYEDKDGNQRTSLEMQVDDIGPSMRFSVAQVQRAQQQGGGQAPQQGGQQGWAQPQAQQGQPPQGWPQQGGAPQAPSGPTPSQYPSETPW